MGLKFLSPAFSQVSRPKLFWDTRQRLPWPAIDSPEAWAIALVLVALTGLAKLLLDALSGAPLPPYIMFYPAVVVAALGGGPRIGLATAIATLVIAWWFFLPEIGSFVVAGDGTPLTLLIYSLTSTFLGWVVGQGRRAHDEALASRAQREYAARESVHRVKNLLAVVQAIVSKVFREVDTTEKYRNILFDRLTALNIAQGVLVQREWEDVPVGIVIDSSLAPFLPNPGLTVERGPEAIVPARCVAGLCMALYELSTNAMKYGALAEGRGPVVLGWRLDGNQVTLEWNERTPADPNRVESFGAQLIRAALGNEPSAQVDYRIDADGVYASFRWRSEPSVP